MPAIINNVYEIYSKDHNITFIMEDIYDEEYEYLLSTSVKGFYYGEPDEELTAKYYGDLKADFTPL